MVVDCLTNSKLACHQLVVAVVVVVQLLLPTTVVALLQLQLLLAIAVALLQLLLLLQFSQLQPIVAVVHQLLLHVVADQLADQSAVDFSRVALELQAVV